MLRHIVRNKGPLVKCLGISDLNLLDVVFVKQARQHLSGVHTLAIVLGPSVSSDTHLHPSVNMNNIAQTQHSKAPTT